MDHRNRICLLSEGSSSPHGRRILTHHVVTMFSDYDSPHTGQTRRDVCRSQHIEVVYVKYLAVSTAEVIEQLRGPAQSTSTAPVGCCPGDTRLIKKIACGSGVTVSGADAYIPALGVEESSDLHTDAFGAAGLKTVDQFSDGRRTVPR